MDLVRRPQHAIVLGGSMAGLLAARVLADHFEKVTLIERDRFPTAIENRKGVPQGRHFHVLLKKGEAVLSHLFPGLVAALTEGGATVIDIGAEMRGYQFGGYKVRCKTDANLLLQSRPFLEWHVRQRVLSLKNVEAIEQCDGTGLLTSSDHARVTGLTIQRRAETADKETLATDFLVDATGRGSQSPKWLEAAGYPKPDESLVTIDVRYTSRVYRRTSGDLPGYQAAYILPKPPFEKRFGALFPMEENRWIVTLGGWLGDHAPADEQGFLEFARNLPAPDIFNVLKNVEPLTDFDIYKFPSNRRRHYERVTQHLEGYIVLGDALCSFNPVYGQGMTVSALQAQALDECLREQQSRGDGLSGLPQRFFEKATKAIDPPWMLATCEDFRYPAVTGTKTLVTDLINWYSGKIHQASMHDPEVYRAFLNVLSLLRPPASLFEPRIVLRALIGSLHSRAAPRL